MSIEKLVVKQYQDKVDKAYLSFKNLSLTLQEGWLRTVRIALGMSVTQLAKIAGLTRARVSKIEKDEFTGNVTLNTMHSMAEAMDCQFVYAVVPKQKVKSVIKQRAIEKASAQVKLASTHMALEAQSLTKQQLEFEVERIAADMMAKLPRDFWSD